MAKQKQQNSMNITKKGCKNKKGCRNKHEVFREIFQRKRLKEKMQKK